MPFRVSERTLFQARHNIFTNCMAEITNQGFIEEPFDGSYFGKNNNGDYNYDYARLREKRLLETLSISIIKEDKWIQVKFNIFNITPELKDIHELKAKNINSFKFVLPPNSISEIRMVNVKSTQKNKLGHYWTEQGYHKQLQKLESVVRKNLQNIDTFYEHWHKTHKPRLINWQEPYKED